MTVNMMFTPPNPSFERTVRDVFAQQQLMVRLGASLVVVGPGYAELELPSSAAMSWREGHFASSAVAALAESAGACAALTLTPAGSDVMTVDYKINFIRPARGRLVRARGRVVRAGHSLTVARVDVRALALEAESACALLLATVLRVDA